MASQAATPPDARLQAPDVRQRFYPRPRPDPESAAGLLVAHRPRAAPAALGNGLATAHPRDLSATCVLVPTRTSAGRVLTLAAHLSATEPRGLSRTRSRTRPGTDSPTDRVAQPVRTRRANHRPRKCVRDLASEAVSSAREADRQRWKVPMNGLLANHDEHSPGKFR
jgi:hypothetical protein